MQKALLMALLTPDFTALQDEGNLTELLVLQEEIKTLPFGAVWEQYCRECDTSAGGEWFAIVKNYENEVLKTCQ